MTTSEGAAAAVGWAAAGTACAACSKFLSPPFENSQFVAKVELSLLDIFIRGLLSTLELTASLDYLFLQLVDLLQNPIGAPRAFYETPGFDYSKVLRCCVPLHEGFCQITLLVNGVFPNAGAVDTGKTRPRSPFNISVSRLKSFVAN